MKAEIQGNDIVIRLPVNFKNPVTSKTGKTKVVATTNGNQSVDLGEKYPIVQIGVNVFINPKKQRT